MGALQYAGPSSGNPTDLATKRTVDTAIQGTSPNQTSILATTKTAIADRATIEYVDKQDSRFAPSTEFKEKDEKRNVLKTSVNSPNNPVTLPIETFRFPSVGAGYTMGPYGWQITSQYTEGLTSSGSPIQIASLVTDVIPKDKRFFPIAFGQVLVTSADTAGLPVVDIKSGGGLLLATGRGRTMWTGGQGISAMPCYGEWTASNGGALSVTMWLSDFNNRTLVGRDGPAIAVGGAIYIVVAA